MRIEFEISGQRNRNHAYFTWSPVECHLHELDGETGVTRLVFRNANTANGGQVVFGLSPTGAFQDELDLDVDFDVPLPTIFVAGKFDGATGTGFPSTDDDDAAFEVVQASSGGAVGTQNAMVRIRKNANDLTVGERDRFLDAFGDLNDRGAGNFGSFRLTHTNSSNPEAHGLAGFLPWHRAYLLDLERELQLLDSSVTIPYWKFDAPAPKLFQSDFFGVSDSAGKVQFDATNPLFFWATDGVQGVDRIPRFNTSTSGAQGSPGFSMRTEANTLTLGNDPFTGTAMFERLTRMEARPHGAAHDSFRGISFINVIHTAAKDPLFFLLHCNVDRLWAKWQWLFDRQDKHDSNSYSNLGLAGNTGSIRIGHNSQDSMWPWNQDGSPPRPTPTRGSFPGSSFVSAPGTTPIVEQMIDWQGKINTADILGFDYDDVPF